MKNKILKITCSILCLLGLASCLGDSVGYNSGSGFAYITTNDYGAKIALVASGNYVYSIKSNVVDTADLNVGDCAFLTYKVYSDRYSGGLWYTDDVQLTQIFPKSSHAVLKLDVPPAVSDVDTVNVFDRAYTQVWASNDILRDKWYVGYKAVLDTYQGATVSYYYDDTPARQTGLSKDTVYVDVRINKATTDKKGSSVDRNAVADFSLLRAALFSDTSVQKGYYVYYRYFKNVKTNNVSKPVEVVTDSYAGYIMNEVDSE